MANSNGPIAILPRRTSLQVAESIRVEDLAEERSDPRARRQEWYAIAISILGHCILLFIAGSISLRLPTTKTIRPELVEIESDIEVREDLFESVAWTAEPEPMLRKPGGGPLASAQAEEEPPGGKVDDAQQALAGLAGSVTDSGDLFRQAAGGLGGALGGGGGLSQAPGTGGGGGIGEGSADFFGAAAKGHRVIYVVDRSFSMLANQAIELARRELLKSVSQLSPNMEFQVIFYNTETELLDLPGRSLAPATPAVLAKAREQIEAIEPEGGTEHGKALRKAVSLRPDIVFVLTDAEDAELDLIKQVSTLNNRRGGKAATIHVVQFHHETGRKADDTIKELALRNKGTYRLIETSRASEPR